MNPNNPKRSLPTSATTTVPTETWSPPRGIWYETNKQRPTRPFMLKWSVDGKSHSQSFTTTEEREEVARALAGKREYHGREILNFDTAEWRRWLAFKEQSGGVDPLVMLAEWRALAGKEAVARVKYPTPEAIAAYMAFRSREALAADTRRHLGLHLERRFATHFADVPVATLTPPLIEGWLDSLTVGRGDNEGEPVDPVTRRHHLKSVIGWLEWCRKQGWIERNPAELVPMPEIEEEDVELLTVDEGRRLFEVNAGHRIAARLALEAFGFLRASSAGRIQKEHINFAERGIRMPGSQHKSRKAKFREGHPSNLWAWLLRAPDETWDMNWWEYRNEKQHAFVRAGLTGSQNRLRKTCLSAHLAWQKNQPLTAYLAQHSNTYTTDTYLGVMTELDGAAWFGIGPAFLT